jgi:hypothetical protein
MRKAERAQSRDVLLKRIKRLLDLDHGRRSELRSVVLPFLDSLGSVAIRDVARAGKGGFLSDYDFVIYDGDHTRFIERMEACQGIRNRFGGYALKTFDVKVDVWHIEDTWARTAGHASVTAPSDLLVCTFFDWDSAVYDLTARRLFVPDDYFERLRLNVMDIRLEENPNPTGSLVRALRRAAMWQVGFGSRLTAFCQRLLAEASWDEIVDLDERAFTLPLLYRLNRDTLLQRFARPQNTALGEVTWPVPPDEVVREEQLRLPIFVESPERLQR